MNLPNFVGMSSFKTWICKWQTYKYCPSNLYCVGGVPIQTIFASILAAKWFSTSQVAKYSLST